LQEVLKMTDIIGQIRNDDLYAELCDIIIQPKQSNDDDSKYKTYN